MLKLLCGRARSGKTYNIMCEIEKALRLNRECVLIVPEQYTLESEKELLKLSDGASVKVPVLSFTRLCDAVSDEYGGNAGILATDSDRIIIMGKAVESVRDNLKFWHKKRVTTDFCSRLLTAVNEFKTCAFSEEELNYAENSVASERLRAKLSDLKVITAAYETLLSRRFIDPIDSLTRLFDTLGRYDYFKGKTVFFDSFKGFTGQQYAIIEKIIEQSDDCVFALSVSEDISDDTGLFAPVNKVAEKLYSLAKRVGVKIHEPEYIGEPRYNSDDLTALELYFSTGKISECDAENINICSCRDVFEEASYAAGIIRKNVRENGYRYRDFVVIARNSEIYRSAVNTQFNKCGIPVFSDSRLPAASLPLIECANRALKSVLDFKTENILGYVKTGLSALTDEEIYTLENYVYIWKIEGKRWLDNWDMDPDGMNFREEGITDKIRDEIKRINEIRIKTITPLVDLRNRFTGNAVNMGKALFSFLSSDICITKLKIYIDKLEKEGKPELAADTKQSFDVFCSLLDSTVECCDNESPEEFCRIFNSAVSFATVGRIPQMIDEVVFGDADKIRPSRPKIAIVLGMNAGVFPAKISVSGVLDLYERNELIRNGIALPDKTADAVLEENYLVYTSLCCPSDKLYVTYSSASAGEYRREPSRIIELIKNNFSGLEIKNYGELIKNGELLPETLQSAFSRLAVLRDDGGEVYESIKNVLSGNEEYRASAEIIDNGADGTDRKLSLDTSLKLFGKNMNVSATKFDTFNRCRFSYFCKFGLGAKVLQRAEVDVRQKGLIVHYVLQKMFERFGKEISTLSDDAIRNEVSKYIAEYLSGIEGANSIDDAKFTFMLSKIETIICEIVSHLACEFAQSEFVPVAFELKIGQKKDEVEPPEIKLENGGNITIVGSIDRVDRFEDYIRIVDYKTGTKTFKLPDIVYGLNMQMLLYLYSVVKSKNSDYTGTYPAGVFYLPAKRSMSDKNVLCMSGAMLDDERIASAMEVSNDGEFVPKYNPQKKKDGFYTAEEFEIIFSHLNKLLKRMGNTLHSGDVSVSPLDGSESKACKYCDFKSVCKLSDSDHTTVKKRSSDEVFELLKAGDM